jgi:hypothetical protein
MAMLTNAYETQVVQSLGVRIGPSTGLGTGPSTGLEASAEAGKSGSGCPFSSMIPGMASGEAQAELVAVRWTAAAEARLANVPEFVRPMARTGIERFARERGALEVDEKILDAARDFFGM